MTTTILLDLTGLKCPLPALRTRKELARMQPGLRLDVRCTDPLAAIDIPHLVNEMKHRLLQQERRQNGIISFLIEIEPI